MSDATDINQMLNDLVYLAETADASCRNNERGARAALSAYGQKHREIVAFFEARTVMALGGSDGPR